MFTWRWPEKNESTNASNAQTLSRPFGISPPNKHTEATGAGPWSSVGRWAGRGVGRQCQPSWTPWSADPRRQLGLEFWIHSQSHPEPTEQSQRCSPRGSGHCRGGSRLGTAPQGEAGWGSSSGSFREAPSPRISPCSHLHSPPALYEPGGGAHPVLPDRRHASPGSQSS